MSKRRGFTLTEIVVVIALTSLVLAMVGGCLYFVSTYSGTLISKSEELTKVQTIETYLRGQVKNEKYISKEQYEKLEKLQIDTSGNLCYENDPIIKNTGFSNLKFVPIPKDDVTSPGEYFLQCQLIKDGEYAYSFILGIVNIP